ncbi:MAG: porin, partial [Gammaproteobacteria bacterium]|nr:porin [Gammaproteobacteria bacterium]
WNIYGWQNHSWEFVDIDGGRSFDRIQSNAGNIGFAASMDAGNDISVNVQCEQFTYYNHFAGGTGWCNRNSKIGLSHPQMGEIMFATWLLPYNEGVAQWVDPFYDAGADSHTSIMGSVGAHTIFYNTGDFDFQASASGPGTDFSGAEFNYAGGGYDTGFNRRQENIIQYWSPNWNGFVFRFAWTAGNRDEIKGLNGHEVDPVIRSSSLAYTNGPFWGAVTWQDHEDWTAVSVGDADDNAVMETSDAESIRIAGRYIMDLGDGMSVQLSAMWENLEYEFNGVVDVDSAMSAFGYGGFAGSYDLLNAGNAIGATAAVPGTPAMQNPVDDDDIKAQKIIRLIYELFDNTAEEGFQIDGVILDSDGTAITFPARLAPLPPSTPDNPLTKADETVQDTSSCHVQTPSTCNLDDNVLTNTALMTAVTALNNARDIDPTTDGIQAPDLEAAVDTTTGGDAAERNAQVQYQMLVDAATDAAKEAAGMSEAVPGRPAVSAATNRAAMTAGQNVKIERDAWMVSGKIKFGGPIDFRFSYMDADDLEVSCASCSGDWDETAADAWNVGVFYTMPGGTELRLTYSEVDNDDNGTYGQGISGTGLGGSGVPGGSGGEIEMFAVGIVHWFD